MAKKNQNDPSSYFTGGFSIMKDWQKEHGTAKPKNPTTYQTGGFDIMKKFQKKEIEKQKRQK